MTRYILLLLALLLLSFTSASMAEEASPELRIKKFKKTFLFNPQKAFGYLKPLDHPRLVSYVIDFWEKYGQLGYYYSSAAEEAVMTTKGEKALGELYGQMMRHDKSWMRANLARVVGKIKKPGCDKALMGALSREKESDTLVALIEAAQTYPSKDMERMIFKFTRSGYRPEVRLVAVEALGVMGSEDSVRAIAKLAVKDKTEIRCAALWALGNLKGEIALKTILDALTSDDAVIRAAACNAASLLEGEQMRKALCDLLQDENWQVVSAAVRSLRKRNELEAVVPLVKAMQNAKGRLLEDFHEALVTITGYKFGLDPANWKAWLDETGGEVTRNPKPRKNETPYVTYHKIKTRSKNMMFIIDISGSMAEKVAASASRYLGDGAEVKGNTKLAFVKAELIRTIKSLPNDAKFDIITFEKEAKYWRGAQTLADEKGKKQAVNFVDNLNANGGTNVYEALQFAYGKLRQNTGYFPHDRSPDTMFLLSDGMPTVGAILDPAKLISMVTRLNRTRQVVINTIGVGSEAAPLLKPLAEKNSGKYILIAK